MVAHLLRKLGKHIPLPVARHLLNTWRPFRGAGIKVTYMAPDFRHVEVSMRLRWYNTNYVGVHFGGSIYAMVDPFYMLMLMQNLGDDYIVWDKGAAIDFKKPGKGLIRAIFQLDEAQVLSIKELADSQPKHVFSLPVTVLNEKGEVVATIQKTLYVRRKDAKPPVKALTATERSAS